MSGKECAGCAANRNTRPLPYLHGAEVQAVTRRGVADGQQPHAAQHGQLQLAPQRQELAEVDVLVAARVRLAHERDELATLDRQLHLLHRVRELLDTDAARLIRVEGGEDRTKLLLLGVAQVLRTVEDGPLRRPM